jgi:hypothetical protein
MPWRRKPRARFRYWTNGRPSDANARGFKTILVYCLGDMPNGERCWHSATVPLDRLPDGDWYDICASEVYRLRQRGLGLTLAPTGRKSSTITKALAANSKTTPSRPLLYRTDNAEPGPQDV